MPEKRKDEDLLREATERCERGIEAEKDNFDEALDDLRFCAGDQWTAEALRARKNRPTLKINRILQYIHQIVGDVRLNKPAVKVRPADGAADVKIAQAYEGLIRHIEQQSDADTAYVTAVDNAARCGMGAFRIGTRYSTDDAFDQDIYIGRIKNPMSVIFDPNAQELTREDADWTFVINVLSKDEFKARYPDAVVSDFETAQQYDWILNKDWWTNETVRVAEYWKKIPVTKRLGLTEDGKVIDLGELSDTDLKDAPQQFKRIRTVETKKVVQYIISGAEVLSGPTDWPTRYIPIIPVWGEEIHLGEKLYRHGIVRFAKDPQRMYNYYKSADAELTALTPKSPFIITPGQIEGQEQYWQEANTSSRPYLLYNRDGDAPKPQREPPPQPNAAAVEGALSAAEDMNATTGIYPPSLGQKSNESSGKAILARERQGDVGSYLYVDNLSKAIGYAGKQLVALIPEIYDTQRVVRILGPDGSMDWIEVNQSHDAQGMPIINPATGQPQMENDLSVGEYDVEVETGPSFSTKRDEASESMMAFMQAVPQSAALIADLIAQNQDWPGADEMAKRLRKALPPGIATPDKQEQEDPQVQQAQQMQMQEAEQMKALGMAKEQAAVDLATAQAQLAKANALKAMKEAEAPPEQTPVVDNSIEERKIELQAATTHAELSLKYDIAMAELALEHDKEAANIIMQTAAVARQEAKDGKAQQEAALVAEQPQVQMDGFAKALEAMQANHEKAIQALAEAITAPRKVQVTGRAPNGSITEATSTVGTA